MSFVDLLRTTVLLCAGAATTLAAITVIAAGEAGSSMIALAAFAWWAAAGLIGAFIGRRNEASPPIARLLATARAVTTLPEQKPTRVVLDRLWPVFAVTLIAGLLGLIAPQIPGIATGFTIIWALAWRRQHAAVSAIEQRDGARFHVEPTSPLKAIRLTRTPGFKAYMPQREGQAA